MRPGLHFASGHALTAEHAAWSLQRVLRLNLAPATVWKSYGFSAANATATLRAEGPQTVVIDLPQPTNNPKPNPVNPPSGCRFHTRCPQAMPRCWEEDPALRGDDAQAVAWLAGPESGFVTGAELTVDGGWML